MLRIAKVRSGGERYYFLTRPELAASPDGLIEPEPYWLGSGAGRLGLEGAVSLRHLGALLRGSHPGTGDDLTARGRDRREVAAFDVTISVPKSVSVLHAIGGVGISGRLAAAHTASVSALVTYLEDEHIRVRRSSNGVRSLLATDGIAAAAFPHRTSRANDPHLHTHLLVANLVCGHDGRWSALDGRLLFRAQRELRALVEAHLRHELSQGGIRFGPMRRDFADVAAISPETVREFSRQGQLIAALMREEGLIGVEAAALVAEAARPAKDVSRPYEELRAEWRERGHRLGLSQTRLEKAAGTAGRDPGAERFPSAGELFEQAADGDGTFTRGDAVVSLCSRRPQGAPIATIRAEVEAALRESALPSAAGRFTTPLLRARAEESGERLARLGLEADATLLAYGRAEPRAAAFVTASELAGRGGGIALSPGRRAARRFEACTGIESFPVSVATAALRLVGAGERVFISDAAALTEEEITAVLRSCAAKGASPVFVTAAESFERSTLLAPLSRTVGRIELQSLDERPSMARAAPLALDDRASACVAPRLVEACAIAARLATDLGGAGSPVRVVVPDRSIAPLVRREAPQAVVVTDWPQADDSTVAVGEHLLVLGGAGAFGASAGQRERLARTHVLVQPCRLSPDHSFALVLEAVLPSLLVESLGSPRTDPIGRRRWHECAVSLVTGRTEPEIALARDFSLGREPTGVEASRLERTR